MRNFFEDVSSGIRAFAPSQFPYPRFLGAVAIGLVGALLFVYLKTPLPWMLGSMATTTIAALGGLRIMTPSVVRTPMVVIVGVMVGANFTPDILHRFTEWWPTVLGLLLLGVASGLACFAYLRAFTDFNVPTAYFSGMPGGLIEMVVLAEERGADIRMVALVHSVRILIIVFTVPIIVSFVEGVSVQTSGILRASVMDAGLVDLGWLLLTAVGGVVFGHIFRVPAIYLLGPLLVSASVHVTGLTEFKLPSEILNFAQLIIGTSIGCRFAGVASGTILKIFGMSAGMSLVLVAVTALFAYGASALSNAEFAPVLLAYAPGGLAEMCLVAVALQTEVAFVAAHHMVRLFFVMGGAPLVYSLLKKQ